MSSSWEQKQKAHGGFHSGVGIRKTGMAEGPGDQGTYKDYRRNHHHRKEAARKANGSDGSLAL